MNERFEAFTVLLNRINRNIRKIKNEEMANYELRSPHISCIYYLYISKELTARELCDRCEEDKATISRSLDYLEKNGYIICKSDSKKRYNAPFELTERGMRAGKRIAEKIARRARFGSGYVGKERLYLCASARLCTGYRQRGERRKRANAFGGIR